MVQKGRTGPSLRLSLICLLLKSWRSVSSLQTDHLKFQRAVWDIRWFQMICTRYLFIPDDLFQKVFQTIFQLIFQIVSEVSDGFRWFTSDNFYTCCWWHIPEDLFQIYNISDNWHQTMIYSYSSTYKYIKDESCDILHVSHSKSPKKQNKKTIRLRVRRIRSRSRYI